MQAGRGDAPLRRTASASGKASSGPRGPARCRMQTSLLHFDSPAYLGVVFTRNPCAFAMGGQGSAWESVAFRLLPRDSRRGVCFHSDILPSLHVSAFLSFVYHQLRLCSLRLVTPNGISSTFVRHLRHIHILLKDKLHSQCRQGTTGTRAPGCLRLSFFRLLSLTPLAPRWCASLYILRFPLSC